MYKELVLLEIISNPEQLRHRLPAYRYTNPSDPRSDDEILQDMFTMLTFDQNNQNQDNQTQDNQKKRAEQNANKRRLDKEHEDKLQKMRNAGKNKPGWNEPTHWPLRKGPISKLSGAVKHYVPGAEAVNDLAQSIKHSFQAGHDVGRRLPSLKNQNR